MARTLRLPRFSSSRLACAFFAGAAFATGCGGPAMPRASAPVAPVEGTKCKVSASQANPIVTEWPASEKANLEVLSHQGGVVVAYSGCEMRVLPQCSLPGTYAWQRTTPASDFIEIHNDDELWAKLPLGAASLEGELQSGGRLAMQTTVSGQLRLTGTTSLDVPASGVCAGATHVIGAISVGAFQLKSGGALSGRADASVVSIAKAHADTASSEVLVREAGKAESCDGATDAEPPAECRSPIQVFLWPLAGTLRNAAPPGTVKVNFTTSDAETVWEVVADDRVLCETPCVKFLPPTEHVLLREKDPGFLQPAARIAVDDLAERATSDSVDVRAHPTAKGELVGGMTATSLAGATALTGVTLTAVGCGGGHDSMCTAGLVTLPIGLLALIPSIWLMVDAGARADVEAASRAGTWSF
jgi:hypothetical protein